MFGILNLISYFWNINKCIGYLFKFQKNELIIYIYLLNGSKSVYMARVIDETLKERMDAIRSEVPDFWRKLAQRIDPDVNLDNMAKVLIGRSHREDCIELFEQIVNKTRAMETA